jgi:hypothetical protein
MCRLARQRENLEDHRPLAEKPLPLVWIWVALPAAGPQPFSELAWGQAPGFRPSSKAGFYR